MTYLEAVVMPLLRESYGRNYVGDENTLHHFERVTKVIGLRDAAGRLVAAALLEEPSKNRLINVATSPDKSIGKRGDVMLQLLEVCKEEGTAAWISIGEKYIVFQALVQRAGMERVQQDSVIAGILMDSELQDHYQISHDHAHEPVIVTRDGYSQGYVQQVWAWQDKI